MAEAIRVAVWSGPRNISTALMRSWGQRADTVVVDEPFYAHYLVETGVDHPAREEVIRSQPTDWRTVAGELTEVNPFEEISFRGEGPQTLRLAAKHCNHAACPVPSGIIKAIEVASGLALPRDAVIEVKKEG